MPHNAKLAFKSFEKSSEEEKLIQMEQFLKLVPTIFKEIFILHQMIALQKLWKIFFFHLKSSFRSRDIQVVLLPPSSFCLPVSHCSRAWSKINLKVYGVINCLNKNLITHFFLYLQKEKLHDVDTLAIDTALNKGQFMEKSCRNIHQKLVPDPFLFW